CKGKRKKLNWKREAKLLFKWQSVRFPLVNLKQLTIYSRNLTAKKVCSSPAKSLTVSESIVQSSSMHCGNFKVHASSYRDRSECNKSIILVTIKKSYNHMK